MEDLLKARIEGFSLAEREEEKDDREKEGNRKEGEMGREEGKK